ncbi:MAG: protein kinase [Gemmataceae bacterium]|nr:protein kinase [Gemmataceae bacterium]MDW8266346.1 protein kinase [Gemmataceae bacterium]
MTALRVESLADLVDAFRTSRVLEPGQLAEVAQELQFRFADPRGLARELMERNWLTPYQVNQIFLGRGRDLCVGSYILLDRLAESRMGQVFKARHQHMKRDAALTVIREDLLMQEAAVERLYSEIQAVSQLAHPNIAVVYDAGPVGRTHFIAMEHVEGTTLDRLVEQGGPMSVEEACSWVWQIALGLDHAHRYGLLHRDLKPANLLWPAAGSAAEGVVKIRNLGLTLLQPLPRGQAQVAEADRFALSPDSADYVAPERVHGDPGDIRSDLYSLGAVLYLMLAGHPPFPGGNPADKVRRHLTEVPLPLELTRADIPDPIAELTRKLLAKNPEERPATPYDVATIVGPLRRAAVQTAIKAELPPAASVPPADFSAITAGSDGLGPSLVPQYNRRHRWSVFLLNVGGVGIGLALLLTVFAWAFWRAGTAPTNPDSGASAGPGADQDDQLLRQLAARMGLASEDQERVRNELLRFAATRAGTPQGRRAAWLVTRMPSPLDRLNAKSVPAAQRYKNMPKEVVAVLGERRGRHWGIVGCLVYDPKGRWLISGGSDALVRLWDATTLEERAVLSGHASEIRSLAVTPDGRILASADADGSLRLWELKLEGPELKIILYGHKGAINSLAVSPDGRTLASGGDDKDIRLWDLTAAKPSVHQTIKVGGTAISAVAFSPDGKFLAAGFTDGILRIWRWKENIQAPQANIKAHDGEIRDLCFSPDNDTLATLSGDRLIKLWTLVDGVPQIPRTLNRPQPVSGMAFLRGGTTLATGVLANIQLWNVAQARADATATLSGHVRVVRALAVSPDGKTLASGSADGTIRLWEIGETASAPRFVPVPPVGPVSALAFAPDAGSLAVGNGLPEVLVWNLNRGVPGSVTSLAGHRFSVWSLAYRADGKVLISGSADGSVRLWDLANPEASDRVIAQAHQHGVRAMALAAEGTLLATSGNDQTVRLWDLSVNPPKELTTLQGHNREVLAVAISLDGKMLFSGDAGGNLRSWRAAGAEYLPASSETIPDGSIEALALAPNGQVLVAGTGSGVILSWQLSQKALKSSVLYVGHTGATTSLAYGPDGQTLVSASRGGEVIVWDIANNRKRAEWKFPGPVLSVAIASDGRHIATGNANGTVFILRLHELH